ncbi:amino acid transporter [Microbacterium sp.]|jgi:energy-coupling factor transporter transmembrane protein EcfT|uniref:amino acid transporter n=1 Tax=Microbacterium sp. TaxID=51671 RepID=UPI002BFC3F8E|nr:amino acid transporter [Microbacterium sp.]HWL78210.1 amino acid transporter [Microbacterium sp.]
MTDRPTRRALMKPLQFLGLALLAAVFAGVVTLVSMGFFQSRTPDQSSRALVFAAVVAGITFIVALVGLALMLLAVDPAEVQKTVDRPVLIEKDERRAAQKPGRQSGDGPDAPAADRRTS